MSFTFINPGPVKRSGRPRCAITHLVALEWLLWPGKRPAGLQKQLAHANGIEPRDLCEVVQRIRRRVQENSKRP